MYSTKPRQEQHVDTGRGMLIPGKIRIFCVRAIWKGEGRGTHNKEEQGDCMGDWEGGKECSGYCFTSPCLRGEKEKQEHGKITKQSGQTTAGGKNSKKGKMTAGVFLRSVGHSQVSTPAPARWHGTERQVLKHDPLTTHRDL